MGNGAGVGLVGKALGGGVAVGEVDLAEGGAGVDGDGGAALGGEVNGAELVGEADGAAGFYEGGVGGMVCYFCEVEVVGLLGEGKAGEEQEEKGEEQPRTWLRVGAGGVEWGG